MVAMALWHLELRPGQPESVYVRRDFQITNVALGEELTDSNGRSVVKVTHSPINPVLLESDDEDSDDEDFDESEDEEDEDEESQDEVVQKAAKGGKKAAKEGKTVEEIEDDEDMEDDLSEGSDFSFDQPEATAVIAALTPGKIEQVTTNLIFVKDEAVIFEVTGKNVVHLMGNYIHQEIGGHDHGHHDDYDDLDSEYDDDEEIESDDEDMGSITSSQVEDMERMFGNKEKKQARIELLDDHEESAAAPASAAKASNKRKAEQQEVESPAKVAAAAGKAEGADELSKNAKKKLAKKQKVEGGAAVATEAVKEVKEPVKEKPAAPKEVKKSNKQTLPSGLIIEDTKLGEGPVAKPGKRLGMRYIGKLTNGKQFDANTAGAPFKFVLGRGEVIKGWDQGISGMKVGGERRLTIPASLAYGKQKLPGIPANSTLVFEIKLVDVK